MSQLSNSFMNSIAGSLGREMATKIWEWAAWLTRRASRSRISLRFRSDLTHLELHSSVKRRLASLAITKP